MIYHSENGIERVMAKPFEIQGTDASVQDAESIWRQTAALGRLAAEGTDIDMIALSATYHSVMMCNSDMTPATPVYQWAFRGAGQLCKQLQSSESYVKDYYQATGCMVNAIYPSFKLMWMKAQGLDISKGYIMEQGSYNNYRATGKRWVMDAMTSGSGLMDINSLTYHNGILNDIGIKAEQLCELVTYKNVASLTDEAAGLLGIKSGIPVIVSGPDGGLNQVGAGALKPGIMTFSVGTSGAVRFSSDKPKLADNHSTWCYRSPKTWMSGAATSGCCNCVDWARNSLFSGCAYHDIEANLNSPDGDAPFFLPFLFGERCPGWNDERNGGFEKLNPRHDRYDLYLSVLEGVLFNLFQCYQELTKLNGQPERIMLSGGILHSPFWLQMCADIFGQKMEISDMAHGSVLGAAAEALEIGGVIKDIGDFDCSTERIITPNESKSDIYSRRFSEYLKLYNCYTHEAR
jgi:gluconokinase